MMNVAQALVFELRDRGTVISIPRSQETIYELDGKRYRCYYLPEQERLPGEGAWRTELIEKPDPTGL